MRVTSVRTGLGAKKPTMTKQDAQRGIDILAKSIYRDLKQNGYSRADIMAFASNILGHLTQEPKDRRDEAVESTL